MHRFTCSLALLAVALAACLVSLPCLAQNPQPGQQPGLIVGAGGRQLVPDTYNNVNWKGPPVIARSVYDRLPIHQGAEFSNLLIRGQAFVGRVKPRTMTLAQALALGKQAISKNGVVLPAKAVGSSPKARDILALQAQAAAELLRHRTFYALGFLMLAYEAAPRETAIVLNLASVFAAAGLPNEAIAFLDEADRLGGWPTGERYVSPKAVAAYLRGYSEMLRGNLPKAKQQLALAHKTDSYLREAALALAVAQAQSGEMEEARKTYSLGVWRRIPARVVIADKEDSKEKTVRTAPPGSPEAAAAEDIVLPVDEAFDLSGRKDGVMPTYPFPRDAADVIALGKKFRPGLSKIFDGISAKRKKAAELAQPSLRGTTREGDWARRYKAMIGNLQYRDPNLAPLYMDRVAVETEFESEWKRVEKVRMERAREANRAKGKVPCSVILDISNQAISSFRPTAEQFDMASRRYYRLWYPMTTGLVAQVDSGLIHEWLALQQQSDADYEWHRLAAKITTKFELLLTPGTGDCVTPKDLTPPEGRREDELEACPDSLRGKQLEFEIEAPFSEGVSPKLSLAFACDKVTFGAGLDLVHVDAGPMEFGAGPYGEIEIEREGDVTIFVAGSAGGAIGPESGAFKAGGYVKANREGIKDVGVKAIVESKISTKIGGASVGAKVSEELGKLSFVPSVPEPPRGPMLKQFGGG